MAEPQILRMFERVLWQGLSKRKTEAYRPVRRGGEQRENAGRTIVNIRLKRGRPVSTGILMPSSHVELSGSRKSSGKMQLPIKNWHSQLNYLS
jgi:hypothetical protein